MSLISEIMSIETEAERNERWFYHGFTYEPKDFENIITKGIKAAIIRPSLNFGYNNGPFYISLSKEFRPKEYESAFWFFNLTFFTIIVEKVMAVPCIVPGDLGTFLSLTPLPLRKKAGWTDEYQTFGIIPPKKYVGIQCPIIESIKNDINTEMILDLKEAIEKLKALGLYYPIYDYSRLYEENKVYTINQDEYLALTRKMSR